jgi:hypothetical protein
MKTAMQELMRFVDSFQEEAIHPRILRVKIKELLEKEKEQIENAYHKGGYLLTKKPYGVFVKEVEEYYNENYNQNK